MTDSNPNNSWKYKAIIFDVMGTLVKFSNHPCSSTIIDTLQTLKSKGVMLFALSSDTASLQASGFPKDLLILVTTDDIFPIADSGNLTASCKSEGVEKILRIFNLKSDEVVAFGDDSLDIRAAQMYSVAGRQVTRYSDKTSGFYNDLEELIEREFNGVTIKNKPQSQPLSDLPKPKPFQVLVRTLTIRALTLGKALLKR